VIGASVYRVPVDDTALIWQLADEAEPAPEPERDQRIARVHAAFAQARQTAASPENLTPADLGLSDADIATFEADMRELERPPVTAPEGFARAVSVARATGLIAPVVGADDQPLHLVHRWTARAIAQLHPDRLRDAHHRAARYWRWRVDRVPQPERDDIAQLLEARYHHYAAGELDAALELSGHTILTLETWGEYGHATELCRETVQWVPEGSTEAAGYTHQLGVLAQRRGDWETARRCFTESLEMYARLGEEDGLASGYHQLGMLAQHRGDDETAELRYSQSLEIKERLGDQPGLAITYAALAVMMSARGDEAEAVAYELRALSIRRRIGDPYATAHLRRLAALRARVGRDAFSALSSQVLDRASDEALQALLDEHVASEEAEHDDATAS
jgi:tetratricopeptide (TPR) repeat protein